MKKIILILVLGALAAISQATLVVQSDANNFWNRIDAGTGANIPGTLPTQSTSGAARIYDNDLGTAFLVNGASVGTGNKSTYTGPSIFMAMQQVNSSAVTAPAAITLARSQVTGMQITSASFANTSGGWMDILLVANKADFANGMSSQTLGFSAADSFKITFAQYNANAKSLRAVVKNGNTWYISQTENTTTSSDQKTVLTDASSALWAVWDPLSSIDSSTLNFSTTVAGSTFKDIQAVGFYSHLTRTGAASATIYQVTKMDIGASAIPEPATIGMLGLGALITLLIRRIHTR